MPKVNWKFLKKTPVIIGGIVLFFVVLWMMNRGASSQSGSAVVTNTGPSDAQIAAATQLSLAGISASVANNQTAAGLQAIQEQGDIAVALKTIDAASNAQALAAQQAIAAAGIAAQVHGMDLSYETSLSNNELAFNTAKLAYDSANYSIAVNAGLEAHLSDNQLSAYDTGVMASEYESFASVIPSLNKGMRDNALNALILSAGGTGGAYAPGSSNAVYVNPSPPSTAQITYSPPSLPQTNWVA